MTLTARCLQPFQQFFLGKLIEILCKSQTVTSDFQAADGFLEGFFIVLADAHDFAHGTHLCAQLVFHTFELFECPAGKLDYHIVAVRHILIQCAILSAGNISQCQAACQHGRYQSDGKTGRFGGQGGGTGCSRINLNDDDTVCHRIMGKLYVGTADDLNGLYNLISLLLQTLLDVF